MAIQPPQIPGLTDWRPLARGGFAVVWEARQESLDRLVAVKVDQRRLDAESERMRFLREAGAAGRMSAHPGIVTVHDAGILSDDRPYLVMDLCPGGSLTRYLKSGTPPSESRVREIGVRIADALAATHARGVLHRDVKPANILIDTYDNVGLADFGLAAISDRGLEPEQTFEALTPAYTAPEILRRQPPSAYGDVYSLAATLYALLAGRPPRWPESGTPTLDEVLQLHQQPVPPLPDVDPGLNRVLQSALALDPAARPDAVTFRDQLRALDLPDPVASGEDAFAARAGTGTAVPVRAGSSAAPASEPPSRWRRSRLLVPLVALLLAAILAGALLIDGDDDPGTTAVPGATPTAGGSSTAPASPSVSSVAPTPVAVPEGYQDCSEELGQPSFCTTTPECWAGIISVFESPSIGTPRECNKTHVYQTFAAGELEFEVRRQPQLESNREVRRLCRDKTLRPMLSGADRRTDWEILALPPQQSDGTARIYRCLFGRGDRSSAVPLKRPS